MDTELKSWGLKSLCLNALYSMVNSTFDHIVT
jgi:hypothetical protein